MLLFLKYLYLILQLIIRQRIINMTLLVEQQLTIIKVLNNLSKLYKNGFSIIIINKKYNFFNIEVFLLIFLKLTNMSLLCPQHSNPIASKLRKLKFPHFNKNNKIKQINQHSTGHVQNKKDDLEHVNKVQLQQKSIIHEQEEVKDNNYTKNVDFNWHSQSNTQKAVLKQISINNIFSAREIPTKTISKLINCDSQSVLNKSYSISGDREKQFKAIQTIKILNQSIKTQIQQTDKKLTDIKQKKQKLQQKYTQLKQNQTKRLETQIKRLKSNSISLSHTNSLQIQWQSILQNSTYHQPKCVQSRLKMVQLKNKMNELQNDISSMSRFAKDKKKRLSNNNVSNQQN